MARSQRAADQLLIADIGGTNARFAVADAATGELLLERTLACALFPDFESGLSAFVSDAGIDRVSAVCIAAAGPVIDRVVRLTNSDWVVTEQSVRELLPTAPIRFLNDFEAVAYAIPALRQEDCKPIGELGVGDLSGRDYAVGILGPGTGLGVAGASRQSGREYRFSGEGGNVGFAPATPEQVEILRRLQTRYEYVSNERLLSGPGIENLYQALAEQAGREAALPAATIFELAASRQDDRAEAAVRIFFEVLGQVAGDLALILGASDGIFVAGGIVPRYPALLANSDFRRGFVRKGRHASMLRGIPTALIARRNPGMLGACRCGMEMVRGS